MKLEVLQLTLWTENRPNNTTQEIRDGNLPILNTKDSRIHKRVYNINMELTLNLTTTKYVRTSVNHYFTSLCCSFLPDSHRGVAFFLSMYVVKMRSI